MLSKFIFTFCDVRQDGPPAGLLGKTYANVMLFVSCWEPKQTLSWTVIVYLFKTFSLKSTFVGKFVSMDEKSKEQENAEYEDVKKALKERGYTFEFRLGKGSFGFVFQAKHSIDELKYAIKVLPVVNGEDAKYRRRELDVLTKSNLWKRNIVKYYTSWQTNVGTDLCWLIAMELCVLSLEAFVYSNEMGGAQIIQRQGTPRFYQRVFPQLLNGLSAMHSEGLVHRDIHPSNILIANPKPTEINQVNIKIADFGLSREIASVLTASPSLTDAPKLQKLSANVGNKLFRAPELATEYYDYKVDLYSAGIMLYFLSRYLEDKKQWRADILALTRGERGQDDMCHQDDQTLFYLFSSLLRKDPNKRLDADEALKKTLAWKNFRSNKPTESTVTDGKIQEKKFFVKVDGEETLKRRFTNNDSLDSLQEVIEKCTGIKAEFQELKQKTTINDEEQDIDIESDLDVRCMFESAKKNGKEVVIVVSENNKMDTDYVDSGDTEHGGLVGAPQKM